MVFEGDLLRGDVPQEVADWLARSCRRNVENLACPYETYGEEASDCLYHVARNQQIDAQLPFGISWATDYQHHLL